MSETVHYKGVLRASKRHENETLEDHCKRLLEGRKLPTYHDSYQEMLLDEHYKDIVICDGIIYHVEKQQIDPDWDIYRANMNEDGTISFEVRYYNGGCSFSEAIEDALSNMSKK